MQRYFISKKSIIIFALWLTTSLSYSQNLKIFHIDVDQADATLFIAPNGLTLLVDAGKNGHGSRIKEILDKEGITRIDHFVNTHYHEDHYGGIDDLINDGITVSMAYDRGDKAFLPRTKLDERTYKDYQTALGNRAIALSRGMRVPLDSSITVTCISQGGVVLGESDPETGTDENDMSLSLFIKYGNFTYFVGGDIEEHTESKIAERDLVMDVDVYQANHHGSHTSSSVNFMEDLKPSVVVISNGNNDSYYHPRQVTLTTFRQLTPSPVVFQTNKYLGSKVGAGNVIDEFIGDLDTNGDEGTILIEVNLDEDNYAVTYRNQIKNFSIKSRVIVEIQPNEMVIEKVLPDPAGSDLTRESVTIKNKTTSPIPLAGWVLQDASSRIWPLNDSGPIQPGQSLTIQRNGMPMSLNNDGDLITLISPNNLIIDEFRYAGSVEGVEIVTGHFTGH